MKNFTSKTKFLTLAIVALSVCFNSCSNDDDDKVKYPKTLSYKKTEAVEFKIYVGSENGGKEVSTADLDPADFWPAEYFKEDKEWYEGFSVTFIDDNSVKLINKFDSEEVSALYKFEGDKLSLFNEEENEWSSDWIWGNKNKLTMKSSFSKHHKITTNSSGSGNGSSDEHVNITEMIGKGKIFESLSDMKHKEDTVMWYNLNYIYE